jgi:hypothetical protein
MATSDLTFEQYIKVSQILRSNYQRLPKKDFPLTSSSSLREPRNTEKRAEKTFPSKNPTACCARANHRSGGSGFWKSRKSADVVAASQ